MALRNLVLDTTVIINFFAVGRGDLFEKFSDVVFWISEHVRGEVADFEDVAYSLQLDELVGKEIFHAVESYTLDELALFGKLRDSRVLGEGECAAISLAVKRDWILATDDKAAGKEFAQSVSKAGTLCTTQTLLIELIKTGELSIAEADDIKDRLARDFRFRMKFDSFMTFFSK